MACVHLASLSVNANKKCVRFYRGNSKQNPAHLAKESGKPISEIAEELGVGADLVYRWRRELNSAGTLSFPGHGKQGLTEEQRRIKELEKKLRNVEQERDILKKALAIFSKAPK